MKRILATTLCGVILSSTLFADVEADTKAVDKVIRDTVDSVLEVLQNDALARGAKRERVTKIIEPVVDFELMAKLILGRKHWPKLDKAQRKTFTDLLVEALKTSYFDKLVIFSDEKVGYGTPVPKKNKFQAETFIITKGERIAVVYKLYKKKGKWTVYDFEIEGVSIVKSYGAQYGEFLKDGTVEKLLERMKKKVEEAEKREKEKEEAEKKKGAAEDR